MLDYSQNTQQNYDVTNSTSYPHMPVAEAESPVNEPEDDLEDDDELEEDDFDVDDEVDNADPIDDDEMLDADAEPTGADKEDPSGEDEIATDDDLEDLEDDDDDDDEDDTLGTL